MSLAISIIPAYYSDVYSGTVLKLDQHSELFDKIQMSATSNALQQEVHTPLGSTYTFGKYTQIENASFFKKSNFRVLQR